MKISTIAEIMEDFRQKFPDLPEKTYTGVQDSIIRGRNEVTIAKAEASLKTPKIEPNQAEEN